MAEKPTKTAIIVHSGTLDKLYPVFTLASTGGSIDMEVHLFFTFWGLNAVKKGGLESKLPGVMSLGTGMMKGKIKSVGVPSLPELLALAMCKDRKSAIRLLDEISAIPGIEKAESHVVLETIKLSGRKLKP